MIGVLLLTHGALAEGILNSTAMIVGENENIGFVSLLPGMTFEYFQELAIEHVDRLDKGCGVLIITDIIGGTPFNVACLLTKLRNIAVITGLNLGMALSATLDYDNFYDLEEFAISIKQAGLDSIKQFENPFRKEGKE